MMSTTAAASSAKTTRAVPDAATSDGLGFHSVEPARVLDTRSGLGAPAAPIGPGGSIDVQLTGTAGVPLSGVAAVVVNLTAVAPTAGGYLTAFPAGSARFDVSNLNFARHQTVANQVIAKVGVGGKVTIFNAAGSTHVVGDVTGWFGTGSYYNPEDQFRILDTRIGMGATRAPVGSGRSIDVPVPDIPSTGVAAVAVNITGTGPTSNTFVTAYPSGQPRPGTSNLNLVAGQTAAVLAIVKLGAGGRISLYNDKGSINLIADVAGWFTASGQFTPLTPTRVLDTRTSQPAGLMPGIVNAMTLDVTPPLGTYAAAVSVTAVNPSNTGFLSVVHPSSGPPTTSTLDFTPGRPVANLAIIPASSAGTSISMYTDKANTQVVVDVQGWFVDAPVPTIGATAPDATLPASYSTRLTAAAGKLPYTWSVVSGTLPAGLSLAPSPDPTEAATVGVISGTPTTAGTSTFTVRVTDALGLSSDLAMSLTVHPFLPGAVWTWGAGAVALAKLPGPIIDVRPTRFATLSGVTAIARMSNPGIGDAGLALRSDGTVWAWGFNNNGELGDGTDNFRTDPVRVSGLTGVTAIAGGGDAGYALTSDGTVWAWGGNASGQLGNGTTTNSSVPVQVPGLTGVTAIAGGDLDGYALKSDGTLWAWGDNASGQLGNGTTTDSAVPVQVPGLTGVTVIAGGDLDGYAMTSDGTLWAWGDNGPEGKLGNGTTHTDSTVPVRVSGLTGVTKVVGGEDETYALKSDGTVWAWADNSVGQLGNGTTTDSAVPVQVSGLTGVTDIAANSFTGYAVKSDGTVWGWGEGNELELGPGTTTFHTTPIRIAQTPPATAVAAGGVAAYLLGTS